jgi:RNA-directed DNA polymerase
MANLALDGLETRLRAHGPVTSRNGRKAKVPLRRDADDCCMPGASKAWLAREVKPLVAEFLQERGLTRSPEKPKLTPLDDGFEFLGQHLRKDRGTLFIKPSRTSVHALVANGRRLIKAPTQRPAGKLIAKRNPILRGWAPDHRHVVRKAPCQRRERALFDWLWRWAKRSPPQQGVRWVKTRDSHAVGQQQWRFSGEVKRRPQGRRTIALQR